MSNPPGTRRQPCLLIVEDDDELRFALASLFELDGFVVHSAGDLSTARAHLALGSIDMVLLDMRLGNGELGGELMRDIPPGGAPAVILLSGSPELAAPISEARGVPFFLKPFDYAMLLDVVNVACNVALVNPALRSGLTRSGVQSVDHASIRKRKNG